MTDGAGVSAVAALAEEFQRVLSAHAAVLARVGVAPVDHMASVHEDLALAAEIFVLPVVRQLEVAVDGDLTHAADEAVAVVDDVVHFLRLRPADVVPGAGDDAEQLLGAHRALVDLQHQTVRLDGQDEDVPAAVVELLVVVVQDDAASVVAAAVELLLVGLDLRLHPAVLQEDFDIALRGELVVDHQPAVLVRAEGERHVHRLHSFVALQLGVGRAGQEGHGHDGRLRAVVQRVHLLEPAVLSLMERFLQLPDEVRRVQVNVLDAAGEVLRHDEAFLPVRHAADVQHAVQVQLVEVAFDLSIHNHAVHREENVATVAGDDDVVPNVIIEQTSDGEGSHDGQT